MVIKLGLRSQDATAVGVLAVAGTGPSSKTRYPSLEDLLAYRAVVLAMGLKLPFPTEAPASVEKLLLMPGFHFQDRDATEWRCRLLFVIWFLALPLFAGIGG